MESRVPSGPSLATFALVRGGASLDSFQPFINSRRCLHDVLAARLHFEDIAFHEGNVPQWLQLAVTSKTYALQ